MLVFVEEGKPENPEKNPRNRDENQQQLNLHVGLGARFSKVPKSSRTRKVVENLKPYDYRAVSFTYCYMNIGSSYKLFLADRPLGFLV